MNKNKFQILSYFLHSMKKQIKICENRILGCGREDGELWAETERAEMVIIVNINKSLFILSFSLMFLLLLYASYLYASNPHRYIETLPKYSSPNQ